VPGSLRVRRREAARTGSEMLAVVNLDARDTPLTLADGTACRSAPLPYAVP